MLNSMTGFGEASTEMDGIVYTVEVRTVNNRYFKPHLRIPDIAAWLEADIEKIHREKIHRGVVNYSLTMKNISGNALFEIDENTASAYLCKLKDLAATNAIECRVDMAAIMALPGIIRPVSPDSEQSQKMKDAILQLTEQAIERLLEMRLQEGEALTEDMLSNCRSIAERLDKIADRSGLVINEYHEKLQKRASQLLADAKLAIDGEMIAREVAIFAERSDISEEITRLGSHLDHFAKCCHDGRHAGRRLDFISQEMLREANTIGSKASDSEISRWVIDVKCAVDRIKEQVQNVE